MDMEGGGGYTNDSDTVPPWREHGVFVPVTVHDGFYTFGTSRMSVHV